MPFAILPISDQAQVQLNWGEALFLNSSTTLQLSPSLFSATMKVCDKQTVTFLLLKTSFCWSFWTKVWNVPWPHPQPCLDHFLGNLRPRASAPRDQIIYYIQQSTECAFKTKMIMIMRVKSGIIFKWPESIYELRGSFQLHSSVWIPNQRLIIKN